MDTACAQSKSDNALAASNAFQSLKENNCITFYDSTKCIYCTSACMFIACIMYILYTLSRHNGRRKHQFMRLGTKFKLRQFISISIVLQAQQDVLIHTNTKLDLYIQCINTCVQILSPVLFNIHHTGTAGCSLRIHSKARKFIQHMRSKCANCSWMLMASKSLGRKQNLYGGYVVDIVTN